MLLKYLVYLVKHKYYVFIECCRLGIPIRGVFHDWSKFLPDEFIPYYKHFHGDIRTGRDNTGYYKPQNTGDPAFEVAWLLHQNRHRHHWQYWCLPDKDGNATYEMPISARKEMLADWKGAGRAQGTPDTKKWYLTHRDKLILGPQTRRWIEDQLGLNIPEDRTDVGQSTKYSNLRRKNIGEALE